MPGFLYPNDPLHPRLPEPFFADEFDAILESGFEATVFSLESLVEDDRFIPASPLPSGDIIYRGWMLFSHHYEALYAAVLTKGARLLTDPKTYLSTHHLPKWYPLIAELTPETHIFPATDDIVAALTALGWSEFFVKDYVKSLKTSRGCAIISDPTDVVGLAREMRRFRGTIEGGFCIRRVEDFILDTEQRYFVFNRIAHASEPGEIPDLVLRCAERIHSPFFSVDIAQRADGLWRVVELGDGQVSDLVGWSPAQFTKIFGSSQSHGGILLP